MKRLSTYLTITILAVLYACSNENRHEETDRVRLKEIEAIPNNFFKALGTGDTTLLKSLLTPDFFMFEHDEYWTADSLLKLMHLTLGRVWEVNDLKMNKDNKLVHVSYFNNSLAPQGRSWYESMLIINTIEGLKIKFMHSTKLYLK